jgi:hypothetical protein
VQEDLIELVVVFLALFEVQTDAFIDLRDVLHALIEDGLIGVGAVGVSTLGNAITEGKSGG